MTACTSARLPDHIEAPVCEGDQGVAELVAARAALGFTSEVVCCCECMGSAIVDGRPSHGQPLLAGLDVDDDGHLRLLMLSPPNPSLGLLLFRLLSGH